MSKAGNSLLGGMDRLRNYVRKRMRDPDSVEDVVQEALVRVMEQERRQAIEHPLAYAYRVADSVILAGARRARRIGDADMLDFVCDLPLADEVLDYRQRYERFEAALARLTPARRAVFRLRHMENRSRQEIAEELGISVEAVKKHLVRAMADLALALEDDLGGEKEGHNEHG
ncbi:RNA polymerase subunit sigma-70 [Novosphingobium guangzhouense]|uniref:RNA polymerase subunit sigma-70 n=2 Tax=Novosphingobium guangzhouense TaxID=1850347 RepID=A0A2K2FXH9_9SPHN|nr:RNA polymerase subunit sigma-70 [Novosphingobium guangzhouense]